MASIGWYRKLSVEAKASIAYTACSIIQRGMMVLTLPIFTRLMTVEQYGVTSVYLSWLAFFAIVLSLNLPYGSFQTAMVKFEGFREKYVSSLVGIFLLLSAIFLLVYLPFSSFWNDFLGLSTVLVLVMVAEVVATSCIQAWMGLQRFENKYKSVFIVTVCLSVLSQGLSLLFVVASEDKGAAKIIGSAVVTCLFGTIVAGFCIFRGGGLFNGKLWKYALGFNIPLIIYYLSQVVFNQSDILIISFLCGKSDAALYNVAYSLSMLLTFLITAIQGSYTPWFYKKLVKHEEKTDRIISKRLALALACLLLLVVASAPEIVYVMAGLDYMEAIWVVPPVAGSVLLLFYACLLDRIFFFYEKKLYLTIGVVIPAFVNIVLNMLLIPHFGFIAAGYTTFVSYFLLVCIDYLLVKKISKEVRLDMGMYDLASLSGILLAFVGMSFTMIVFYPLPGIRYLVLVLLLCVGAFFRKKIMKTIGSLKKEL